MKKVIFAFFWLFPLIITILLIFNFHLAVAPIITSDMTTIFCLLYFAFLIYFLLSLFKYTQKKIAEMNFFYLGLPFILFLIFTYLSTLIDSNIVILDWGEGWGLAIFYYPFATIVARLIVGLTN